MRQDRLAQGAQIASEPSHALLSENWLNDLCTLYIVFLQNQSSKLLQAVIMWTVSNLHCLGGIKIAMLYETINNLTPAQKAWSAQLSDIHFLESGHCLQLASSASAVTRTQNLHLTRESEHKTSQLNNCCYGNMKDNRDNGKVSPLFQSKKCTVKSELWMGNFNQFL